MYMLRLSEVKVKQGNWEMNQKGSMRRGSVNTVFIIKEVRKKMYGG